MLTTGQRALFELAIKAPSGDNCQPWRLRQVSATDFQLINDESADTSIFNFQQRASYIAQGAFLQNLELAASRVGITPTISLFPDESDERHIADITLTAREIDPVNTWSDTINARQTNRRKYQPTPLPHDLHATINTINEQFSGITVNVIEDREQVRRLAEPLSLNDSLPIEFRAVHDFLFSKIRWTKQDAKATRDGLDVATLGLSLPDQLTFRLLGNWKMANVFSKLKMSAIVESKLKRKIATSSAAGIVTVDGSSSKDFVRAGQAIEQLWLECTALGVAFQPLSGVTFMAQRLRASDDEMRTKHEERILDADHAIQQVFNVPSDYTIAMPFRLGANIEKAPYTLRKSLDDLLSSAS